MTDHPTWLLELIDTRIAENLEREALEQITDEFGTPDVIS